MILLTLIALSSQLHGPDRVTPREWHEFGRWKVFHRETTFSPEDGPVAYDETSVRRRGDIVRVRLGEYSPRSGLPDTLIVSRVQVDCVRRAVRVTSIGLMNRQRPIRQPFAPIRSGSTEAALADELCRPGAAPEPRRGR